MTDTPENPSNRRSFFREAIARAVEPLADYIDSRLDLPSPRTHLRPPGAVDERRFLETCYRCGACVDACPAGAIFPLSATSAEADGTPAIDPERSPCVVCEGLVCTHACPSGALLPLSDPHQIRMGIAEVYDALCTRSDGERCTICADHCPIGPAVIRFPNDGSPTVLSPGCVGCGVCQMYCPTTPRAIVIKPS